MRKHHLALITALGLWLLAGSAVGAADPAPQTTRRIVFEKTDKDYRYKLTEGPVTALGDHQVLVHMRAVALNRGDWEILTTDPGVNIDGRIAGSDGAGDIVAVGTAVRGFHPGEKVTSLYFRNWTNGPPDAAKVSEVNGLDVNGVFGDYVALDDTAVVGMARCPTHTHAGAIPTTLLAALIALTSLRAARPGAMEGADG